MFYHIKTITHTYAAGGDRNSGTYLTTVDCFAGRPFEHATRLISNLFRSSDANSLKKQFAEIGYTIQIGPLVSKKKVGSKEEKKKEKDELWRTLF